MSSESTVADPKLPPLTAAQITDDITKPLFTKPPVQWHGAFGTMQMMAGLLVLAIAAYVIEGYGIFGVNQPVNWGNDITTYIFWIGIAVAGTLVSSVLFLFRQQWRTAINRSTEAMTVFAVQIAGLFPLIHTGRPWVDFWLMPYPNDRLLWPNLKSAIVWDVFALTAYATTSIIFWYYGLIPDFATVRDRAKNKYQRMIYSVLAMGWRGKANDWVHYERAYAQFAWIATPLVVGMHSTIAILAAIGKVPGWHATIFGPYFVSGAIFGGLAMAIAFLIPMRSMLKLERYITIDHLEKLAKVMLVCGLLVSYVYVMEFFSAWWSESTYERHQFLYRLSGNWSVAFWIMLTCNFVIPQLLWLRAVRRSLIGLMFVAIAVNIGMWFERFVIISLSVMQDHLPSSWDYAFRFTMFDWMILIGSFGLFFTFILGFCRVIPVISIAEIKAQLLKPSKHANTDGGHHG
jgi:molybdopterin-containing oxidoreductase family membrane subunit